MGRYLDRTTRKDTESSTPGTTGEIQLYSPVAKRVKQAIEFMANLGADSKQHGTSVRVVGKLASAALDDFAEVPPEIASIYLSQLALMVEWCATGVWKSETIPMPEGFGVESG